MRYLSILLVLTALTFALALPPKSYVAPTASYEHLENIDAFASSRKSRQLSAAAQSALKRLTRRGAKVHVEERLGVPTFLWAADAGPGTFRNTARGVERTEVNAARQYLRQFTPLYQLNDQDVETALVTSVHNTGRGAIIVRFRTTLGGIEVFRDELKVVMNRDLNLVALSGYIPSGSLAIAGPYRLSAAAAVATAFVNLTRKNLDPHILSLSDSGGGYSRYTIPEQYEQQLDVVMTSPARTKQVFFHLPDVLVPAYYVEVSAGTKDSTDSDLYAYVISALDQSILFRQNLTAKDSYTYRVWADNGPTFIPFDGPQGTSYTPHPTGLPDGFTPSLINSSLVTLQNAPFSKNDPWLPPGASELTGNNVEAYADLVSPDGFQLLKGDFRPSSNGVNTFDYNFDFLQSPSSDTQRSASLVQLFYVNNFLHDWFYDHGFDEPSGNAQTNNYGRGGIGNDSILAEGQEYSGRDNANMSTPADGGRPRMQVYLWTGRANLKVRVNAPPAIVGDYAAASASFGPAAFDLTGDVVLVNDGTSSPTLGCNSRFSTPVRGKIAMIDRGDCTFVDKVTNAQGNGAVGVIIVNNAPGEPIPMGGESQRIRIPTLMISQSDGDIIKGQLAGDTVNVTLFLQPSPDIDAALDNQVVAHEWAHYMSNRLVGSLGNQVGGGMGEGWSDFVALLMTVREEDTSNLTNTNWQGVYSVGAYADAVLSQNYYFGVPRRVPYSTDFNKDPLTFRHISEGEEITGVPTQILSPDNFEVHNTGEVWSTMLWECYAALLRDTLGGAPRLTFAEAQQRMKDYLVASLKTTPPDPTMLEGRDALLAVAFANDPIDGLLFAQAFARRGAGFGAVAPDRFSPTNSPGLVESYDLGNSLVFDHATLSDNPDSCDPDGSLDNGESGKLTVVLKNDGYGSLANTAIHVTTSDQGVTFPNGNTITNVVSSPFETVTVNIPVTLTGASGTPVLNFTIEFDDPDLSVETTPAQFSALANFDVALNSSATETVEAPLSVLPWTRDAIPASAAWTRVELSPQDHRWQGPDFSSTSLTTLTSPVLNVGPGSFSFSFTHQYGFEFSGNTNFDGGAIEISVDGVNWTDIGRYASPGYNGRITTTSGNPLGGRRGYVRDRASETVTVNLRNTYANQAVRIRFVIGTDEAVGGFGWQIDNLVFNGISNLPFATIVPDTSACGP